MKYACFLGFLALLLLPPITISSSTTTRKLHALIDGLSKVGRVSNAIGLQAGALENTVKFQHVLIELLNLNATSMTDLANLNVKETRDFLRIIIDDATGGAPFDNRKERSLKLFYASDWLTRELASHVKNLDEIKRNQDVGTNDFYKQAQMNMSIVNGLSVSIAPTFVKNFENMRDVLENESPTKEERELLKVFGDNQDLTLGILDQINGMKPKLVELQKLFNSTLLIAVGHANLAGTYSEVAKTFEMIEKFSRDVQNVTEHSRKHLLTENGRVATGTLKKAVEIFRQAVNSHDHEQGDRITWAAGFRSFADTVKIEEDLKSDWFKEKVLKNKASPNDLLSALSPFRKCAEDMQKLGNSWDSTVRQFDEIEQTIREVQHSLEKLTAPPDFMKTKGEVEKITDTLAECKKNIGNLTMETALVENFWKAYRAPLEMFKISEELVEYFEFIEDAELWSNFKKGLNFTAHHNMSDPEVLGAFRNESYFEDFSEGVSAIETFNSFYAEFQKKYDIVKAFQGPHVTFTQHWTTSKIFEFLDCLKTKRFDGAKMHQINEYFTTLYSLPKTNVITAIDSFVEKIGQVQVDIKDSYNKLAVLTKPGPFAHLISNFKESLEKSQLLGRGLNALVEMEKVIDAYKALKKTATFSKDTATLVSTSTGGIRLNWYYDPELNINTMFRHLKILEPLAGSLLNVSVTKMMLIFDKANAVRGLDVRPSEVVAFADLLRAKGQIADAKNFENITQYNLEFSSFSSDLVGAAVILRSIEYEFDVLFGLQQRSEAEPVVAEQQTLESFPLIASAFICFGVILLLFLAALIAFGFTKTGKNQYTMLWLYYFGSEKDFDKRYRYALFMDTVNGHQVVCETAREMNAVTLRTALERGAYVDAYSPFGNTALHLATREGNSDIVEVLIKHGADRSLLNHQNLMPEELLPPLTDAEKRVALQSSSKSPASSRTSKTTSSETQKARDTQKLAEYAKIRGIYDKYRKKTFRRRVPEKFPSMLFRIFVTDSTDDNITNAFNDMFVSITVPEVENNITHLVVKTDEEDALVTSDVEVLMWVLRGAIIVREEWMRDCLEDPKLIEHDERYLVKHLRFRDVLYKDAILPWSEAMAKRTMPYLQGVQIIFAMQTCLWFDTMEVVAENHGATVWSDIPPKERYNSGSHGYYHGDKNCFWIVHDGSFDMSRWTTDPDRIYTVMREDEFFSLLIRRDKRNRVTAKNPIPVLSGKIIQE